MSVRTLFKFRSCVFLWLFVTTFFTVFATRASAPLPDLDFVNALWVVESQGLLKVETSTGQVLLEIPATEKARVAAVDGLAGVLWTYGNGVLSRYAFSGELLARVAVPRNLESSGDDEGDDNENDDDDGRAALAIDESDGSLWLARGKGLRRFNSAGVLQFSVNIPDDVRALSFDASRRVLWAATKKSLRAYDAQGQHAGQIDPSPEMEIRDIAVDSSIDSIWVAGEKNVRRYRLDGVLQSEMPIRKSRHIASDQHGGLWVATEKTLSLLDASGLIRFTTTPFKGHDDDDNGSIIDLVADPADRSAWVANNKALKHIGADGQTLPSPDLYAKGQPKRHVRALALYSDLTPPELAITAPTADSYTNSKTPNLQISYHDAGIGVDTRTLVATANQSPLSLACVFGTVSATCIPSTPLPEGAVSLHLTVKDFAGNKSESAEVEFTVDTIPPTISLSHPTDGLSTNQSALTVTGALSEYAHLTIDGIAVNLGLGHEFQYGPLSLQEGLKQIDVAAIDLAGNASQVSVRVTLDTIPPEPAVLDLVTTVASGPNEVTVSGAAGSVEGGSKITITNRRTGKSVTVTANSDGSFSTSVEALVDDVLDIRVADAASNTASPVNTSAPGFYGISTGYINGETYDVATGAPLAGVHVHARGLEGAVVTDALGRFSYPVPNHGRWPMFFERDGYVDARHDGAGHLGGNTTVGRVAMTPTDNKATLITAASGGQLTDSTGNVQVIFPAGALDGDQSFTATFLGGRDTGPFEFPDTMIYLGGVQMGPEHVIFNKPVTIRVKNKLGLPAGFPVQTFFASHDEDDANEGFYDPGTGVISADGKFVEFEVTHFSCGLAGIPPPVGKGDGGDGGGGDGSDGDGGGSQNDSKGEKECVNGSSSIQHCDGSVRFNHDLPPFNAFGRDDAPTLVYDSGTADPRSYISARLDLPSFYYRGLYGPGVLTQTRARIRVEGIETDVYMSANARVTPFHYLWPGKSINGLQLPTGSYPYSIDASAMYQIAFLQPIGFGQFTIVTTELLYSEPMPISGRVIVNDRRKSEFGAGWGLAELSRLYPSKDQSMLMTRGDGSASVYHPAFEADKNAMTVGTGFSRPSSIAADPQGGFVIASFVDQKVDHMADDGTRTPVATAIYAVSSVVAADGTVFIASPGGDIYRTTPGGIPQIFARLSVAAVTDIAMGPDGYLYVLDGTYGTIQKISPGGISSFFYGTTRGYGHFYNNGFLTNSRGLAFDPQGNLYVSSLYKGLCGAGYISRFDKLGNHSYYVTSLNRSSDIEIDALGNLYLIDRKCVGQSNLKMITPTGQQYILAENFDDTGSGFGIRDDIELRDGKVFVLHQNGDVKAYTTTLSTPKRFTAHGSNFGELSRDDSGQFIHTERDGEIRVFTAQGLHVETRTPQGLVWRYEYDGQGRLVARRNKAGDLWQFHYAGSSVNEIVDPAGRLVHLTHDADNNLLQVLEPEGAVMNYVYDAQHRVVSKTDSRGFTGQYAYGPNGNVTETHAPNGEVRKFKSGKLANIITQQMAEQSGFKYNQSAPYLFYFDGPSPLPEHLQKYPVLLSSQQQDSYTNGRGFTTKIRTNRYGSALNYVDAFGNVTTTKRNPFNQAMEVTTPNGVTTTATYDARGRLTERRVGNVLTELYTYDALDQVVRIQTSGYQRDSAGTLIRSGEGAPEVRISYDANRNMTELRLGRRIAFGPSDDEIITTLTYNSTGQPLTQRIGSRTTRYEYDARGRLVRVIDSANQSTEYGYDAAGNRTLVRDSTGKETHFEYDLLGRMIKIIDPAGGTTALTYQSACATCGTAKHLLTSITDPRGQTTEFEYDALGQLTREIHPNGDATSYSYDANRNLASVTFPDGSTVMYDYDAKDRVIRKTTRDDGVDYTYDVMDNLLSATDGDSQLQFVYDGINRLIGTQGGGSSQAAFSTVEQWLGLTRTQLTSAIPGALDRTMDFEVTKTFLPRRVREGLEDFFTGYDATGQRSTMARKDHQPVNYAYDPAGRLTSASGPGSPSVLSDIYDTLGRRNEHITSYLGSMTLALTPSSTEVTDEQLSITGTLTGLGARDAVLTLNGQPLPVSQLGEVNTTFPLNVGTNTLAVRVTDPSGQSKEQSISIQRSAVSVPLSLAVNVTPLDVTEELLTVTGTVTGPGAAGAQVTINDQPVAVGSDGGIQTAIPLQMGYNELWVRVTNAYGNVREDGVFVNRRDRITIPGGLTPLLAEDTESLGSILAVAPDGNVYVYEDSSIRYAPSIIDVASGTLLRPSWLDNVELLTVDSAGRVYTFDGSAIRLHEGTTDTFIASKPTGWVTDLEMGPNGQLYVAVTNYIWDTNDFYRLDAGHLVLVASLPVEDELQDFDLESSAWGLIAVPVYGGQAVRIHANGAVEPLMVSDGSGGLSPLYARGGPALAVDSTGRICSLELEIVCQVPNGETTLLGHEAWSLQFDATDRAHLLRLGLNGYNVYRVGGGGADQQEAPITGTLEVQATVDTLDPARDQVAGTLTVQSTVNTVHTRNNFGYDARDQLIQTTRNGTVTETYGYDAAGNRISDQRGSDFVYNARNQLVSGNNIQYTYDLNGNRITKTDASGITAYTYDGENRLIRIGFPDSGFVEYSYDPFGRIIQKRGVNSTGQETTRRSVYEGEDLLYELDGTGTVLTEFIHGAGIDEPLAMKRDGHIYYYHADVLGSIMAITDENQNLVQRYEYDAYGNITHQETNFEQPYTYTGREFDPESGLFFYRARYYDAVVGRFIQSDPIGLAGGLNMYAYVENNPLSYTDPLGLWSVTFGGYYGVGAEISFGRDPVSGGGYVTGRIGFGYGGGIKWEKNGGRPGSDEKKSCDSEGVGLGTYLDIGFNAGPLQAGVDAHRGTNWNSDGSVDFYNSGIKPNWGLGDSSGIRASGSIGAEFTVFDRRR